MVRRYNAERTLGRPNLSLRNEVIRYESSRFGGLLCSVVVRCFVGRYYQLFQKNREGKNNGMRIM
jgi:hypothetical protein